jgi:peptidoglycan/LPS O-acetylase OafA/YrhL
LFSLTPILPIIVYAIAYLSAFLIAKKYNIVAHTNRFETIDGLRGFLGIGVFIHHSTIWYQYLHTGFWRPPLSNIYNQLGQTSVAFFFMITAFLFINKLKQQEQGKLINWKELFISRIFRLSPLYLVSLSLMVFIVLIISNWRLNLPMLSFIKQLAHWASFTIFSMPFINQLKLTHQINAGVIWSLPYEWLFYFSLPTLSLILFKKRPPYLFLGLSLLFIPVYFIFKHPSYHHLLSFLGGTIAPFLLAWFEPKKINFNAWYYNLILLISLGSLLFFNESENLICKLLITVIFNLIVLGNNLFGLLKKPALKLLGDISYGTYLLHGIVLFTVMYFVIGFEKAKLLGLNQYYLIILVLTPILVLLSFLGYTGIEKPFMDLNKKWFRKRDNQN